MKILLTGFKPFGTHMMNPTEELLINFKNKNETIELKHLIMDTSYIESSKQIRDCIRTFVPDVIVSFGLGGGRSCVEVERIAINVIDSNLPDNNGNVIHDQCIRADGPLAYASKLPIKKIIEALKENSIPARVSNSAGTYVCNYIMYDMLYFVEHHYPQIKCGFIHVPYVHSQVLGKKNVPSLAERTLHDALEIILSICLEEG